MSSAAEPVRFDHWLDDALYGPTGFYTSSGRAGGRRGDFLTSPEVGPLFGTVLARLIDAEWERLGRPEDFLIVDVGAGPGTLARAVLAARPATGYVCVEVSENQRALHPAGVTSLAELPAGPFTGLVIANELLDNVPFRLAVWDGGWKEAYVTSASDGRLVEVLQPFADGVPTVLPTAGVRHGARAPVQERAGRWLADALRRLEAGRAVVFDYCSPTTAGLALRPWREWLRTYRAHERGGHYLADAGHQDVTVEVCVDQLIAAVGAPSAVRSQAQFLAYWGMDELVEEGRQRWQANAHAPTLAALTGRSRVRESEALSDPAGLGAFTVLEWQVETRP